MFGSRPPLELHVVLYKPKCPSVILRLEGLTLEQLGQAAQSVMRVNGLAWMYEANLSIAQSTVRHSLSAGDIFSSVFDHRWLAYASYLNHFLNMCKGRSCSCFAGVPV